MNVLIDTSVWIDHFRNGNVTLVELVEADLALNHPMVTAELACGTPPQPRAQTLYSISLLRPCNPASLEEVVNFIDAHSFMDGDADWSICAYWRQQ